MKALRFYGVWLGIIVGGWATVIGGVYLVWTYA